jgi:hypothetical protein
MTQNALEQWKPVALALPTADYTLRQPVFVMIGEAHDLAALAVRYWKTKHAPDQTILEPGLELAGAKLGENFVDQLRSVAEALQQAHSAHLLTAGLSGRKELMDRGNFVVGELKAVLEWTFDDGVEDENDLRLARVQTEHEKDPETPDALAGELRDYAALAEEHRPTLEGLGGFQTSLIDEATKLAEQLRALPAEPKQDAARLQNQEALDLRNRVGTMLHQRMSLLRAASRFVFRHHPQLARLFTSSYERKKRAAARRAARQNPPSPPAPTPSPGEGL